MKKSVCNRVQYRVPVLFGALVLILLAAGIPVHADAAVSSVTLSASPASPQLVNTPVTFTAVATGGTGTTEFSFAVKAPDSGVMTTLQPYGLVNTFTYRPENAGAYSIRVFVRDVGSPAPYEAARWYAYYATAAAPVTGVTLSASPASPQLVNTQVTFTATATGGGPEREYEFSVKDPVAGVMTVAQPYGSSNTFLYTPANAGAYSIRVFVRNVGSPAPYEASRWYAYYATAAAPVTGVTLSASPTSPQLVNTPVSFTATATGGGPDREYEFAVKDPAVGVMTVVQPYGSANTFTYTPANAGAYSIRVFVRNVGSPAPYEAARWYAYYATAAAPVTGVTLSASPASPQLVNTPVTFTAMATGGGPDREYEFAVKDPVAGVMTVVQPYGSTNTFTYTPANAGAYSIRVFVRNVGSPAPYEAARWFAYKVSADTIKPITSLSSIPPVPDGANGWFKTAPIIALNSNVTGTTYYRRGNGHYISSRQSREWISGGAPLNIRGDEVGRWYTLPFSFTFYGVSYAEVYLSSNGLMSFVTEHADYYDDPGLSDKVAIAPLWDDLITDTRPADDVYVFQPDADSVGFRWQALVCGSDFDTNFEVILYRDGRIQFNYGEQTGGLYGVIGISRGDGVNYSTLYDGDIDSTNNIDSVVFVPNGWNAYAGPFAAWGGENILYYYSVDRGGNTETIKEQLYKVDTTLPVVSITAPLAGTTNNAGPVLEYTLNKVPAAVTVTVDGAAVDRSSGDLLGPLPEGPHTVRVAVEDHAGDAAFAEVSFTVVAAAPSVSITSPATGITNRNTPELHYAVNYGAVTVTVDGSVAATASGDKLDVLTDGPHTIRVESLDASGQTTFDEVRLTVDVTPPLASSMANFITIAAGDMHSIGITADGGLWQWGATLDASMAASEAPWMNVVSPARLGMDRSWRSAAAGSSSSLALKTDGTLWAWGANRYGQLGLRDESGDDVYAPTQVGTAADWKAVATGGLHSLGLKADGTLWSWGYGRDGQLGRGDRLNAYSPVPVGNGAGGFDFDWVAVTAGRYHSAALKSDGSLWAWGTNWRGQLGDGSGDDQLAPVRIGSDAAWSAVSAGYDHTVALRSDGTLWAWGSNLRGQLGAGPGADQYDTQVRIGSETDRWTAVSAGASSTMALRSDGTLWAWGANDCGKLGDGTTVDRYAPVQINAGSIWSSVAGGECHTLALRPEGTLWTWGRNDEGQLGDGTTQDRITPHHAFGVSDAITINNGATTTNSASVTMTLNAWDQTSGMAFMQFSNDGSAWSAPEPYAAAKDWMMDPQNGTKTVSARFQDAAGNWSSVYTASIFLNAGPTEVVITSPVAGFTTDISPLLNFTVNKRDGEITVWLDGDRLSMASGDRFSPLAEGTHTVKVEAVDANGYRGSSEVSFTVDLLPPTVALHSPAAGLTNDNTPNLSYSLNKEPATITVTVNGIASLKRTGDELGPLSDGTHTVRIDGTDVHGQPAFAEATFTVDATAPSGTSFARFSLIDAGGHHTAAIAQNGTLWTWGDNAFGQLGDGTTVDRLVPTRIGMDSDWRTVSAGDWHTVAVKTDGSAWSWGNNSEGALGSGSWDSSSIPSPVALNADLAAISAGSSHTQAIASDGTVWGWGRNSDGALGNGGYGSKYDLVMANMVNLGSHAARGGVVAAGSSYTLVLLQDGTLWSAGDNCCGQLGNNEVCFENRSVLLEAAPGHHWTAVAAGRAYTVAIDNDGSLWAWGSGVFAPTQIGTDRDWQAVSAGADHTVALKTNGTLWGWGASVFDKPRQIGMDTDWMAISAGEGFTAALKKDGSLWTWGINTTGQLGDGTTESYAQPRKVNVPVGTGSAITINNGAGSTGSGMVNLSLFAWDDISGVSLMLFSNDGVVWTEPEQYGTTKSWALSEGDGPKTVFVRYQDYAGNWSDPFSASIELRDGTPSVTIESPAPGFTNDNTPSLSYTASEGSALVRIDNGDLVALSSGSSLGPLSEGVHTVRVEATNTYGMGYAEVTFLVDSVVPTVTISSPVSGSRTRTPDLSYTASEGSVEVYLDGLTVTADPERAMNALADGMHTVQVEATDAAGSRGHAAVKFIKDTTPPTIYIESPVEGLVTATSVTVIYGVSDGTVTATIDGAMNISSGSTLGNLGNGSHTLVVSSTDVAGNMGSKSVMFMVDTFAGKDDDNIYCMGTGTVLVGPSSFTGEINVPTSGNTVLIAAPAEGSTITGPKTIVKGAMDTTVPVTSVMIIVTSGTGTAGYLAQVNGKYFAARVPVTTDTTTITAMATDQTGTRHQASVSVTVESQSGAVDLLASPSTGIPVPKQSGPAALDVSLASTAATTHPVVSYAWDFDGSGTEDLKCYSHSEVKASFEQTGLYLARVEVTDTKGNSYADTAVVNVLDKTAMNDFFTHKWNSMKDAFESGNIAGATVHFYKGVQEVYSQHFSEIASSLHMLADNMGSFKLVKVTDSIAEGDLRSIKDGVEYSFQVLFIRDANGDWGILSF